MHLQSLIALGVAVLALLFFARKFRRSLAHRGEEAGCDCCDGGGSCGRPRRRGVLPRS